MDIFNVNVRLGSVRDKLGLNTPRGAAVGMTPGFQEEGEDFDAKAALKAGFENLPAPKNDFEIVLEEDLPDGHHEQELDFSWTHLKN